jgi:hypothetical protein
VRARDAASFFWAADEDCTWMATSTIAIQRRGKQRYRQLAIHHWLDIGAALADRDVCLRSASISPENAHAVLAGFECPADAQGSDAAGS